MKKVFLVMSLVAMVFVSCNKDNDIDNIVNDVWEFSQSHPDGFTLNIRTMTEPTVGIVVSYAATQGSHSLESLPKVVEHALEHDGYVGGWLDSESGLYYFDSSRLFPENQLDEALQFARDNEQLAIFVLSSGTEIRVEEEYEPAA